MGTTSRQGSLQSLRFGSIDFAKEVLSSREAHSMDRVAAEHGKGKIISVLVGSHLDSGASGTRDSLIRQGQKFVLT